MEVPAHPRRPLLTHDRHHRQTDLAHDIQRHVIGPQHPSRCVRCLMGEGARPAGRVLTEHPAGAFPPLAGQVCERVDVLLRPRGQGGLGAELQHDPRGGLPSVRGNVLSDEAFFLGLDVP